VVFPYQIDAVRGVATITTLPTVHAADLADTLNTLYLDQHWQAGFNTIWDGTRIREVHVEWSDLQGLFRIQQDHEHLSGPGVDVIVVIRAVDRNLARAYAIIAKTGARRIHIVDSMAEALVVLEKER
jgi:hypothetical protein